MKSGRSLLSLLVLTVAGIAMADWPSFLEPGGKIVSKQTLVDHEGCVYIAGSRGDANQKFYIARIDPEGTLLWDRNFDSTGAEGGVLAIAIDSLDNVIVSGVASDATHGEHWATLKYDKLGNRQWIKRDFGAVTQFYNFPSSIVVDSLDNIYVAGMTTINPENPKIRVRIGKYSPEGFRRWENLQPGYLGPKLVVDSQDRITMVAQDSKGLDVRLYRYSRWGSIRWKAEYNDGAYAGILATTLDDGGNVVLGLRSRAGNLTEFGVVKFNGNNGIQQWAKVWSAGPGAIATNTLTGLAIGPSNSILVAGNGYDFNGSSPTLVTTAKLSASGDFVWTQTDDTQVGSGGIGMGADGKIYTIVTEGPAAFSLRKLSLAGNVISDARFAYSPYQNYNSGLAFDNANGLVYTGGYEAFEGKDKTIPFVARTSASSGP